MQVQWKEDLSNRQIQLMRNIKLGFITLVIALFHFHPVFGQGCSDAGICTLNSFKPHHTDSTERFSNQFKVGIFYGKADHAISVYSSYFEFNRQLNKQFGFDAKLTTISQIGNGLTASGLSDIFANINYKASERIRISLGVKMPLSTANKSDGNLPLPMDYQASLGTVDLIFGMGFEWKKLQFVMAYQQPLTQNNNRFLATQYPIDSKLRIFQSTNKFERAGDVILRMSYPVQLSTKYKLTPSILPIYHLTKDAYIDELNVKREITGSQGLTLNTNLFLDYEVNQKNTIQLSIAFPFIVRDVRPDGLTRSFIANLEYRLRF